jgi:pyruvate kinase
MTTPALTAKDRADIPRTRELAADLVAQSFVRRAEDVATLRQLLGPDGPTIVAKIETRAAVDDFDRILGVADAVMIARGDMGVELPYEEVPIIQKQLVRRALDRGIPSIVATQMLESMIASPRPTRAEASDVANAVFDGADAIMLSGETAIGAYPVLAAAAAARICRLCEQRGSEHLAAGAPPSSDTDARALAYAAVALSNAENAIAGIACYTRTGSTARILASLRPRVPIFAFSPDPAVLTKLALVHGVVARTCVAATGTADRLGLMAWLLGESKSMPAGAAVVLVASTAAAGSGPNLLEVHRIPT